MNSGNTKPKYAFLKKGWVVCWVFLGATGLAYAAEQEETMENNLQGHELLALDDALAIAVKNAVKQGDESFARQLGATRYYTQMLNAELLKLSTHPDARSYCQSFEHRLEHSQDEPNIDYDTQIKNAFSGDEICALESVLQAGCQVASQEKNTEALIALLCIRCCIQKEALQLLLASSNPIAAQRRVELFKVLAQCTAFVRRFVALAQKNQDTSDEVTTAQNQE